MPRNKLWLALPFLGSSDGNHEKQAIRRHSLDKRHSLERRLQRENAHRTGNATGTTPGHALEYELTHQETHQEIAQKSEEDIVHDYNSPIHMWVSYFDSKSVHSSY